MYRLKEERDQERERDSDREDRRVTKSGKRQREGPQPQKVERRVSWRR